MPTNMSLTIDSRSLQALASSVKEPVERLNKVDLAVIRESFDSGVLGAIVWCPGRELLADALTKDNTATARMLNDAISSGIHARPFQCDDYVCRSDASIDPDYGKEGGGNFRAS